VIDPQGDARTTSEGQAYALFFALTDNDRACFDRVLTWTQANLAGAICKLIFQPGFGERPKKASGRRWTPTRLPMPISGSPIPSLRPAGCGSNLSMQSGPQDAGADSQNRGGRPARIWPHALARPVGFVHEKNWTLNPSYMPLFILERLAVVDRPVRGSTSRLHSATAAAKHSSRLRHGLGGLRSGDGFYPAPQHPARTPMRLSAATTRSAFICGWACWMGEGRSVQTCWMLFLPWAPTLPIMMPPGKGK